MTSAPDSVVIVTCEYPPFPGGIGTYAGRLVDAVRDGGFTATVAAPAYPDMRAPPPEPDTLRILAHHGISPAAAWKVLRMIRRAPANAPLLAADIRTTLVVWAMSPLHRRPYRAMIHGSEVSKFKRGSPLFNLVRAAYLGAETICANSRATLEIFSENFGAPRHGVITYLGVEPAWFEPVDGPFEEPMLRAISSRATVVCAVGRIEPRKGQLETVRALAAARDHHGLQRPVLVVAGRPEDEGYAAAVSLEAARVGVPVVAPGRVSDEDMKRLFNRSACHTLFARALPGKIEGFGLVLLEAGAQHCPSVATRVGGIPEVMGETGRLTAPHDEAAFAAAIAAYARDPALRDGDGAIAAERALSFRWRRCAQATFPELSWPDEALAS